MSGPNQLAALIGTLFDKSREDGKQRAHITSGGLKLTVSTYPETLIALSRGQSPPSMDEAATVAKHAGWGSLYSATWENVKGKQYLVIKPDYSKELHSSPDPEPLAPAPLEAAADEPSDDELRALLLSPGPWQQAAMSLRDPPDTRMRVVQGFRRCQLIDMAQWVRNHYPAEYAASMPADALF